MSRNFPAFLGGAPGAALLLLRLCTALVVPLVLFNSVSPSIWSEGGVTLLATSLAAGLGARVAAIVSALIVEYAAIHCTGTAEAVLTLQALQSGALALLGAGAYSIDALLFGRRVIRLND